MHSCVHKLFQTYLIYFLKRPPELVGKESAIKWEYWNSAKVLDKILLCRLMIYVDRFGSC